MSLKCTKERLDWFHINLTLKQGSSHTFNIVSRVIYRNLEMSVYKHKIILSVN